MQPYSSKDLKTWEKREQAPEVYKRNGKYYMFYSAHWKNNPNNELENYKIGVAVADNPLGPFEKSAANPILQKNTESGGIVSGTGHNSVLKDREGKLWCVYHGRTNKTGDDRMVFLDELMLTQNGELKVNGPTVKAD